TVIRKQFPLCLAYATTFNGCQGLTLSHTTIDLRTECFAHGQLYTALSRVRHRNNSILLFPPSNTDLSTINIVYPGLLL
ncbi:helicase, partial [Melanogaster broomeanus]